MMKELFSFSLYTSFLGSVIILLVLGLRLALWKAPRRYVCVLWLLVVVRLLLPIPLESRLSLQPQYMPYSPEVSAPAEDIQDLPELTPVVPDTQVIPDALPAPDMVPDDTPQTKKPADIMQVLAVVWICVAGTALAYVGVSYCVLKYKLRDAVRQEEGVLETYRIQGAFLLGCFRPKIYLPTGLCQQDRQIIIIHEQAHMRRGDHLWKLLGVLCLCIYWYNPLVSLCYVLMSRDIEVACDERVVCTMALEDRKAYSIALLNSGKRASEFMAYPVAFGEINLKQRIKKVLSYRNPSLWIVVVSVMVIVFVILCFVTTPKEKSVDAPGDSMQNSTSEMVTDETIASSTESSSVSTESTLSSAGQTGTGETSETVSNPSENGVVRTLYEGKWGDNPVAWKITSDGVLTISGNGSIQGAAYYVWNQHSDIVTKIRVEDGITLIPQYTFQNMRNVTGVYLSNTLVSIQERAFEGCIALQSVTIPASLKTILDYAFRGCSRLTTLEFAPNCQIESINAYAFSGTGLIAFTSPASLSEIGSYSFENCASLQTVNLREGRIQLYPSSFKGCPNIKQLVLGVDVSTWEEVFNDSFAIETVEIYTSLYEGFPNRTALRSVVIGGDIFRINDNMFSGCISLSQVTITVPITYVGSRAFQNCMALTAIELPDTVEKIGQYAFSGSGLTQITVPASVTNIRQCAFSTNSIKKIVFLGDAPTFVGQNVMGAVTATAYYPTGNQTWTEDKLVNHGGSITWVAQ